MSNSKYIGKWFYKTYVREQTIVEVFEKDGELLWKWLLWKGRKDTSCGSCKDWRPLLTEGFNRIYEFKDYLKRL